MNGTTSTETTPLIAAPPDTSPPIHITTDEQETNGKDVEKEAAVENEAVAEKDVKNKELTHLVIFSRALVAGFLGWLLLLMCFTILAYFIDPPDPYFPVQMGFQYFIG